MMIAITLSAGIVSLALIFYIRRRKQPSLPPGPKGYPVIGNAWDVPTEAPWEKYHEWSEEFGEWGHIFETPSAKPPPSLHGQEATSYT
jgi:hypothetical protein